MMTNYLMKAGLATRGWAVIELVPNVWWVVLISSRDGSFSPIHGPLGRSTARLVAKWLSEAPQ